MNSTKPLLIVSLLAVLLAFPFALKARESLTDDQIKQLIINESIASYPSVCACPYSVARNGSICGARSAYSKPGGYDPICYKTDVTKQMLDSYKRRNNQ